MSKTEDTIDDAASPEEAAAQLAALDEAGRVRVERFTRLRAARFPQLDWEDLLHEAIVRTLTGSRRWKRSLPFDVFVCGIVRSISDELSRSGLARREIPAADLTRNNAERDPLDEFVDDRADPEREAFARERLARIEKLFAGDSHALAILKGMAEGLGPAVLQHTEAMSQRQYAAAQKRIHRAIARALREEEI